jgi:diadenosine tetraphosphatase ApaH/serine/threonine PP2A family protein phosphatase
MRIALLTDIHANREALTACLEHADRQGVDHYAVLGDIVGYGADPAFVVDAVAGLAGKGASVILGNHDEAVDKPNDNMRHTARQAIEWTRDQLDKEQRTFLASLPLTITLDDILLVHASASSPGDWIYVTGPREAEQSLRCTNARITFCGHVHVPALYNQAPQRAPIPFTPAAGVGVPLLAQRRWLGVLGSVGQPRDGHPAACYAIYDTVKRVFTLLRVPYDNETAARKIKEAGLPLSLSNRLIKGH